MPDMIVFTVALLIGGLMWCLGYYTLIWKPYKPIRNYQIKRRLENVEIKFEQIRVHCRKVENHVDEQCKRINIFEKLLEEDQTTFKRLNELLHEGNLDMIQKLINESLDSTRYNDLRVSKDRVEKSEATL